MQVRQINVTDADGKSAQLFFDALIGFYDLAQARALDMFARNGELTVSKYAGKVRGVDAWELGPEHEEALRRIGSNVEVKIGCSYLSAETRAGSRYDLIVIDSPQGAHHDWSGETRFEHFHAIKQAPKLAKDRCIVVLYVNKSPYDKNEVGSHGYDEYAEYNFQSWMDARFGFYGCNPQRLTDAMAMLSYEQQFALMGFRVVNSIMVPCYSDVPRKENYAFRLGLEIVRQ